MRVLLSVLVIVTTASCTKQESIYDTCAAADDCVVPEDQEAACLEKGDDGFCTWECATDEDCDEADTTDHNFVCASFESSDGMHCFPSCEDVDDEADHCGSDMTCRSTGGGSDNRKVCFPDE